MKELNPLEAQLRSWTPRRRSPKLNHPWRNFDPSVTASTRREKDTPHQRSAFCRTDRPGLSWSILTRVAVPTLACLLLTATILIHPGQDLIVSHTDEPAMVALALSNQNFAPYLSGSFKPTANRLDTFGWTNGSGSPSSMRSLPLPAATDLQ